MSGEALALLTTFKAILKSNLMSIKRANLTPAYPLLRIKRFPKQVLKLIIE